MYPDINPTTTTELNTQSVDPASLGKLKDPLDEHLDEMRELDLGIQINEWKLGVHVNAIMEKQLWKRKNYRSAKECFDKEFSRVGYSTLRRYAAIATQFTEEHVRCFGITRLEYLLPLEIEGSRQLTTDQLGELDYSLVQADASEVVKKFKDCTVAELRNSSKAKQSAGLRELNQRKVEQTSHSGLFSDLVYGAVGLASVLLGWILPSGEVADIISVLGVVLVIIAASQFFRHVRRQLFSFLRSGHVLETVMKLPSKVSTLTPERIRKAVAEVFSQHSLSPGLSKAVEKATSVAMKMARLLKNAGSNAMAGTTSATARLAQLIMDAWSTVIAWAIAVTAYVLHALSNAIRKVASLTTHVAQRLTKVVGKVASATAHIATSAVSRIRRALGRRPTQGEGLADLRRHEADPQAPAVEPGPQDHPPTHPPAPHPEADEPAPKRAA